MEPTHNASLQSRWGVFKSSLYHKKNAAQKNIKALKQLIQSAFIKTHKNISSFLLEVSPFKKRSIQTSKSDRYHESNASSKIILQATAAFTSDPNTAESQPPSAWHLNSNNQLIDAQGNPMILQEGSSTPSKEIFVHNSGALYYKSKGVQCNLVQEGTMKPIHYNKDNAFFYTDTNTQQDSMDTRLYLMSTFIQTATSRQESEALSSAYEDSSIDLSHSNESVSIPVVKKTYITRFIELFKTSSERLTSKPVSKFKITMRPNQRSKMPSLLKRKRTIRRIHHKP